MKDTAHAADPASAAVMPVSASESARGDTLSAASRVLSYHAATWESKCKSSRARGEAAVAQVTPSTNGRDDRDQSSAAAETAHAARRTFGYENVTTQARA